MKNTLITYTFHDANFNKDKRAFKTIILEGVLDQEQINTLMRKFSGVKGIGFIPGDMGLDNLQEQIKYQAKSREEYQMWHDIQNIELTNESVNHRMTAAEFYKKILTTPFSDWSPPPSRGTSGLPTF